MPTPDANSQRTTIRAALAADFRSSRAKSRIALVGVLVWLAYEWGPGNETVTPYILVRVLRSEDGFASVATTALVGFGFTFLQQMASGFTALSGFSMFDRTAQASWSRLRNNPGQAIAEWAELGWMRRCAMAFGLGTTAVALSQIMTTGRTGVRAHAKVVTQSALLSGVMVGTLGGIVAALAALGANTPSLAAATRQLVRVLSNPLLWIAIAAFILLRPLLQAQRSR